MTYDLVMFDHQDRDAFRAAFAALSHSSDEASQKRREWWCFDNPNGGAFALFQSGNEVAATCYIGGKTLNVDGKEWASFEIGETATEPAHQRKGLFSKLVKAVTHHANQNSRSLVYGTPNSQSTPGYAKLGFDIVESAASWLFVVVSPSHWLPFKLPRMPSLAARGEISELSVTDYVRATASCKRLNVANAAYLNWRLGQSPAHYRFFKIATADGDFLCAVKEGTLGKYATIVVAEYYHASQRPPLSRAVKLLGKAVWAHYDPRRFLGLYVHAPLPEGVAKLFLKAQAVLPHRQLPICVLSPGDGALPSDWFRNFQLSDCDIG